MSKSDAENRLSKAGCIGVNHMPGRSGSGIRREINLLRRAFIIGAGSSAATIFALDVVNADTAAGGSGGELQPERVGSGATTVVVALTASSTAASLHGALVRELGPWARQQLGKLRCSGYVLSLRVPDTDIDGFSENRGWAPAPQVLIQYRIADEAAAREAVASASMLLPPSARETVDTSRSSVFIATETVVFSTLSDAKRWDVGESGGAPVKMVVQNWKRPDLGFEAYTRHWRTEHARLVREHGPAMGFRRYVQSHRIDASNESGTPAGWGLSPDGGMTEVWWRSHAHMKRDLASPEGQAASALFAADERNFVHPRRMSAFLASETRESSGEVAAL